MSGYISGVLAPEEDPRACRFRVPRENITPLLGDCCFFAHPSRALRTRTALDSLEMASRRGTNGMSLALITGFSQHTQTPHLVRRPITPASFTHRTVDYHPPLSLLQYRNFYLPQTFHHTHSRLFPLFIRLQAAKKYWRRSYYRAIQPIIESTLGLNSPRRLRFCSLES